MHRRSFLMAAAAILPAPAFALYDPKPHPLLAPAVGAWSGTLTYRDYSRPDKMVTLPCKLAVALTGPEELALYYVFDDGPGKIVYSYEKMAFDFKANSLTWTSGVTKPSSTSYTLTSALPAEDGSQLQFERTVEGRIDRHTLALGKGTFTMSKTEQVEGSAPALRHKYEFRRDGA